MRLGNFYLQILQERDREEKRREGPLSSIDQSIAHALAVCLDQIRSDHERRAWRERGCFLCMDRVGRAEREGGWCGVVLDAGGWRGWEDRYMQPPPPGRLGWIFREDRILT